ncbi:MAG: hypothetical protein J0M26_06360 [Planctomycetes bacterium]|nr:hypothetical protein [Planctomycetota bacterium]
MAQKLKWTVVTLFPLGSLVCTPGVEDSIPEEEMLEAVRRHASGDWGDVCEEDRGLNDESLRDGSRLLSVYHSRNGVKFWIITEWDRSATTILLPIEY